MWLLSPVVAPVKKPLSQKLHLRCRHSRWLCSTLLSEQWAHCRAASDVFRVLKCNTQWQVLRRLSSASQLSMLAQTGESHSSPKHSFPASSMTWCADCHAAARGARQLWLTLHCPTS